MNFILTPEKLNRKLAHDYWWECLKLGWERKLLSKKVLEKINKCLTSVGCNLVLGENSILALRQEKLISKLFEKGWVLTYRNRRSPYNDFYNYDVKIEFRKTV